MLSPFAPALRGRRSGVACAVVVALLTGNAAVAQSPVAACVEAFQQTQRLRRDGQLTAARQAAIACAQSQCPGAIRAECVGWIGQLDASIPTVVVAVRDAAGLPVEPLRIEIDHAPVPGPAHGRAIPVDPGRRVFSAVTATGKTDARTHVVLEGQRNQLVELRVDAPAPVATRSTWAPVALAGVAGVALGSFGFFALRGYGARSDLDSCAPACPPSRRAGIERDFLIADVSLAVAAVAGGAALWLWLRER